MSVPNRAEHPGRKVAPANHYAVSYVKPTGKLHDGPSGNKEISTANDTKYFSDRKSAKNYGNKLAGQGYEPYAEKHNAKSQESGYGQPKSATGMNAGFAAKRFMKGH